ncbi:tetratricopeptide repeat protein [Paenibacillus taihuensis]|uniref:Tetratricopeptide repeat protein n=1 Tax=Paenibacillus taihuensis TaxID=1156355 RepID=A0A3D9QW54_9BACL|nr:tetratricopeptide repeat protein [Paenibacillus taihuensis]REE67684.1 tetratricopeptide repeat protein [Paenibacillus taihuensis]
MFRFELALTLDAMDKELEAIPHYEMALSAGLPPDKRASALLSLGSSLRNVGQFEQAKLVLKEAVHEFPDHIGIRCFYALAQYSGGEPAESVRTLVDAILVILPESVKPYAAGLHHYAQQISLREPPREK